jgi:hypothetical protein
MTRLRMSSYHFQTSRFDLTRPLSSQPQSTSCTENHPHGHHGHDNRKSDSVQGRVFRQVVCHFTFRGFREVFSKSFALRSSMSKHGVIICVRRLWKLYRIAHLARARSTLT